MEGSGSLLHPAHEHPLLRRNLWKDCRLRCSLCWSKSRGVAYCCLVCEFFLDETCASVETPLQLQHPSHAQHPLTLELSSNGRCFYECRRCRFLKYPAIAIATLSPPAEQSTEESPEILRLLDHKHPLYSFQSKMDLPEPCQVCEGVIGPGGFYGCREGCGFLLHEQCAHLPGELQHHPFHPIHPLTFAGSKQDEFDCEACSRGISIGEPQPRYCCTECGIHFHVQCARWDLVSQDHKAEIEHFSHPHKLTSFHQKNSDPYFSCVVCMDDLSGESLCCIECRLFLHKSCLEELPRQIVHHAHCPP